MGLKIAMISPFFVRCGIYTYTMNLSRALADLGCEIFGIRIPRFGHKTSEILQNVVDSIPADKVDLVHCQHEYGIWQGLEGGFYAALKRLGKPIVTTCHATGVRWDVDQVIAETSDRVIVHNEFMAKACMHLKRFEYPDKTVIIPHGTKPTSCAPAEECKRELGIDPRAPLVGYVGFISRYKGLETLIEAMRGVPEAGLLIGGGWHAEPGTQYIMDLKQRSLALLPGRCQWLGYVPDERLATVYGSFTIAVYPSIFITESGALLTALSHGKAVIARRLPPVREKERLGALVTFRDVHDLRRKIRRLLRREDVRRRLEEGARKYAESVAWPKIARLHLSLYEDAVEKHGELPGG